MHRKLILFTTALVLLFAANMTSSNADQGPVDENDFAFNAKLLPTVSDVGMVFGETVAISGDTAVVGAPNEEIGKQKKKGAVYVFVKREGVWINQARLIAADGRRQDMFGAKLAIDGDTIVVGVPLRDVGNDKDQGVAYVFTRKGNNWGTQVQLKASGGNKGAAFGATVGISGDTIIIGSPGALKNPGGGVPESLGAAYVFERNNENWTEKQQIFATKGTTGFGIGLGMHGKTAAIAAPAVVAPGILGAQAIFIFSDDGTGWKEESKIITGSTAEEQVKGLSPAGNVAMDGNTLIVGGSAEVGKTFGAVYVYVRQQGKWIRQGKLTPSDGDEMDTFGLSADVSGDRVVVGESMNSNQKKGGAYVFERKMTPDGVVWIQQQKLFAPDGRVFDTFGSSVAISNKTIVAGASGYDHNRNKPKENQGAAYVFSGVEGVTAMAPESAVKYSTSGARVEQRAIVLTKNARTNGYTIRKRGNEYVLEFQGVKHPDTNKPLQGKFPVSYGCEKPMPVMTQEVTWSKNRRATASVSCAAVIDPKVILDD